MCGSESVCVVDSLAIWNVGLVIYVQSSWSCTYWLVNPVLFYGFVLEFPVCEGWKSDELQDVDGKV